MLSWYEGPLCDEWLTGIRGAAVHSFTVQIRTAMSGPDKGSTKATATATL
jgi:hypothetical protein